MLVGASAPGSSILRKFLAGAIAGAVGSCFGTPFDVMKVKAMASKNERVTIRSIASDIWINQGFFGFYAGFQSGVLRSMVLNAVKMSVYDTCK